METTENEHRKFKLNALRYRQPVQFHEQLRYVLVLPLGVDHMGHRCWRLLRGRCGRAVAPSARVNFTGGSFSRGEKHV